MSEGMLLAKVVSSFSPVASPAPTKKPACSRVVLRSVARE
jgi:hypothetical protein